MSRTPMAAAPESEPFPERRSEAEAAAAASKSKEEPSLASPASVASSEAFESAEEEQEDEETASVSHESSEEKFPSSQEAEEQQRDDTEDETKAVTNAAASTTKPVQAEPAHAEPGTPPPTAAARPRPKTTSAATDLPQTTPRMSISSKPFEPLGAAPKNWRQRALRPTNGKLNRIVQAALLKTLLHAIRRGSAEGVRVAIERGVMVQYIDSRQRNLLMMAAKCDTDARLQISIILCDAGCDINHADQLGWTCLHYACASGALDVATELIRRGARVEFNPYGYGPEEFIIPKVARAKSLLQHTAQLQHEQNVKAAWEFFRRNAEKSGYGVQCNSHCDLGKPLKIHFQAPVGHSELDRIRVVDMNADVSLWLQVSKTFSIPPGNVGTITVDSETLDRPSLYRIFYEKYEPTPMALPADVMENNLCVKNLDTGTTVSMGSVNDLVMRELKSTRVAKGNKQLSNSSREAPDSRTNNMTRRMSTTRCREVAESEQEDSEDEGESEFTSEQTVTATEVAEHPAVNSITGVYKLVAMSIVSVSTLKSAKANEYEIVIKDRGPIGLALDPRSDRTNRTTRLIVRRSSGQSAAVNPGDCLVAIGNANIEHAGLKHTLWELNATSRPLVLRFRRGNAKQKKSLFASIRKLSGTRPLAALTV